jgi:hypothetical protein
MVTTSGRTCLFDPVTVKFLLLQYQMQHSLLSKISVSYFEYETHKIKQATNEGIQFLRLLNNVGVITR